MMARTAALKPEQVPADSKPTLDAFTKTIGFTPNMMATFAQSPSAFNSWAALLGSLSKALDVKTRDSIGLAVSEVNGCNYCLTVHSFTAKHMAKLPADEIILARNGHASDPKRDAALQFARKVIETRGKVSDADLKAVRDAGYATSPADLIAISEPSCIAIIDALRLAGWRVGAHNDFWIEREQEWRTFWMWTHPNTGRYIESEGATD